MNPSYRGWEILEVNDGFISVYGTDELSICESIEDARDAIDDWLDANGQFGVGA